MKPNITKKQEDLCISDQCVQLMLIVVNGLQLAHFILIMNVVNHQIHVSHSIVILLIRVVTPAFDSLSVSNVSTPQSSAAYHLTLPL